MAGSPLSAQIARQLVDMIRDGRLQPGAHLREQELASRFEVSRSPIRSALQTLAGQRVLDHRAHQGFFVSHAAPIARVERALPSAEADAPYRRIAAERLGGKLPERFTSADLGRRFGLSRGEVGRVVGRMAQEGWIERRPGYGWAFVPVLTTPEAFALSYRLRLMLEPAALLEPTYRIDREAFRRCRAEQIALVERGMERTSPVELFRIGSSFHEVIVGCAQNPFILDTLRRINRLRRLIEYRAMVNTKHFIGQAREHLEILARLEHGDRAGAAELLRRHLDVVREVKLVALESDSEGSAKLPRKAKPIASLHF